MNSLFTLLFWAGAILGLILHLHAVWHQRLFGDEVHSLFFSALSWHRLWQSPIEPVHPNGYYLMLKAWWSFTPSVLALRFWQWLVFVASTVLLLRMARVWNITGTALAATVALWTCSAYLWHFSFQLRMYGLGVLLLLGVLHSLLQAKRWQALFLSWLSVVVVYGSALGLVSVWGAWLIQRMQKKEKVRTSWLFALSALVPLVGVVSQSWQQKDLIESGFLYWVHTPRWQDWSLGLMSFFTGFFLPYFEGYSALSARWLNLGVIGNGLAVIGMLLVALIVKSQHKKVRRSLGLLSAHDHFLLVAGALSLILYTGLFVLTILFGGHVFHIRQLFSVAVLGWLSMGWFLGRYWNRWPRFLTAAVVCVLAVNTLGILADSRPHTQTYPHHFETVPGTPTVASISDVEFVYKQCGVFVRAAAPEACAARALTLLTDSNTPWTPPAEWQQWWMTPRAQTQLHPASGIVCTSHSVDYVQCQRPL